MSSPRKRDRPRGAAAARARTAEYRLAEQRKARQRRLAAIGGAVVVVAAVVVGVVLGTSGGASKHPKHTVAASSGPSTSGMTPTSGSGALGPEGIPIEQGTVLAPASTSATGATIDGVQCNASEQVVYHIHTHLAVYVNGALRPIPPGIGIVEPVAERAPGGNFYQASRCYYWLHVHAQDGIIHVEAPSQALYTLGNFFAIWRQPLTSTDVAGATGKQTVYVDGKRFAGAPGSIQIHEHEVVQIDVGTDVPPKSVDWSKAQL